MRRAIRLFQNGYEPYIDYLKGYFMLCIVFAHSCLIWPPLLGFSLYPFWACAPEGAFMLICFLNLTRNGLWGAKFKFSKVLRKIVMPFLLIQFLIMLFRLMRNSPHVVWSEMPSVFIDGGYGPGSYFPWVYIQFYLISFAILPLMKNINDGRLTFLFVLLSMGIEILCSLIHIAEPIYRILVLRYLFLTYMAYLIGKYGLIMNKKRLFVGIISFSFIIVFCYLQLDLEPIFFNSKWRTDHGVIYPYLSFILFYAIYLIYSKWENSTFNKVMIRIGHASYGIFLIQLVWFYLSLHHVHHFDTILLRVMYIALSMICCVYVGVIFDKRILRIYFK